jgi:Ca2+/H+ antiporter
VTQGPALPLWTVAAPIAAWLLYGGTLLELGPAFPVLVAAGLFGAVLAAVHHAEVVAHRVGEPFGTLVLAVAVTVIEVGVIVAGVVLLPEGLAALRAARANRLQTSLNLALGSALASIGLTIPAVAIVSLLTGLTLTLGIDQKSRCSSPAPRWPRAAPPSCRARCCWWSLRPTCSRQSFPECRADQALPDCV